MVMGVLNPEEEAARHTTSVNSLALKGLTRKSQNMDVTMRRKIFGHGKKFNERTTECHAVLNNIMIRPFHKQ